MRPPSPELSPDDWRRIRDALRYMGRDLHHRSFAVSAERRKLLWEEMDRCLALADRIADRWVVPIADPQVDPLVHPSIDPPIDLSIDQPISRSV
ncbi:MAG: hypothetical protein VKO39_07075 [Cyanobacteriota bacterium]|nr:hypothetical protein [Cyanobacteriota bacterium]